MRFASVRGFDRPVYAIAAGYLLNTFGSGVVYPFATIHFHLEVGIPFGLVGLGFVAGGVLYAISHLAVFLVDGLTSGVVAVGLALALPRTRTVGGASEGSGSADARIGTRESLAQWGRAVTRPRVLGLARLNVGFAVMYAQMGATVPVFATEALGLTSEQVGTLWVLNPLVIVTLQLPLVARVEAWRRTRGLVLSAGFWAASFLAVAAAELTGRLLGVGLVGAFLVLRTVGEILHAPLITSLASDVGGAGDRGSHLSTLEVAKRLGFGLGATAGGFFFDAGARALLWPALAAVCVGLALGALALERSVSPAENGVPAPGD